MSNTIGYKLPWTAHRCGGRRSGWEVRDANGLGVTGWGNVTQAKRHAQLLAAAPDLLKALRAILADWQSVDPNIQVPDEINVNEHWEAAEAAIAKAEGR